jgi:hypothetical protein
LCGDEISPLGHIKRKGANMTSKKEFLGKKHPKFAMFPGQKRFKSPYLD